MTEGSRPIEFANGSISWREYIRWVSSPGPRIHSLPFILTYLKFPDAASEPTSTLVLTSPSRLYVDIRIFKPTKRGEPELPNEGELPPRSWNTSTAAPRLSSMVLEG